MADLRSTVLILLLLGAPALAAGDTKEEVRARELVGRLSSDPKLARAALQELTAMGAGAEKALLEGWQRLPAPADVEALGLLVRIGSPASLAGLEAAARSSRLEHRRAAVGLAGELAARHGARVTRLLCGLLGDSDPEVADGAAGALRVQAPEPAWSPLLIATAGLISRDPAEGRAQVYLRALGAILAAHPSEERVDELLRRCSDAEEEAAQLRWLAPLALSHAPPAQARLQALLEACYAAEPEGMAALSEPGLRSSPELRALLVQGLAKHAAALPLFHQALRDPSPLVRTQALRSIRGLVREEPRKTEAVQAVIGLLVDPDHDLRREAHRWLQQVTKQSLPLSQPEWQRWAGQHAPQIALQQRLDAWARTRGFNDFQALLTSEGQTDRERWLADQGYEDWLRFLRDQEEAAGE